jgi:hypothetical protein
MSTQTSGTRTSASVPARPAADMKVAQRDDAFQAFMTAPNGA